MGGDHATHILGSLHLLVELHGYASGASFFHKALPGESLELLFFLRRDCRPDMVSCVPDFTDEGRSHDLHE
jgi:hypothetical protein